jgi:hypothetical protein
MQDSHYELVWLSMILGENTPRAGKGAKLTVSG